MGIASSAVVLCSRVMPALGFVSLVLSSCILHAQGVPQDVHVHLYGVSFNGGSGMETERDDSGDTINFDGGRACFPQHWDGMGCPPQRNLRIVRTRYHDKTWRSNENLCWEYCKEMRDEEFNEEGQGCYAWTWSKKTNYCYTYNSHPPCYRASAYRGWISGGNCDQGKV